MLKMIEKLSEKLDLKQDEILEKLGLKKDSTIEELKDLLGVYSIFEKKEDHQKYLDSKIGHQNEKINELKKQLEESNLSKTNYSNLSSTYQEQLAKIVNAEWKKIGGKKDLDIKNLNEKFDFSNINKSLLAYADENQIGLPKQTNTTSKIESNNGSVRIVGDAVL